TPESLRTSGDARIVFASEPLTPAPLGRTQVPPIVVDAFELRAAVTFVHSDGHPVDRAPLRFDARPDHRELDAIEQPPNVRVMLLTFDALTGRPSAEPFATLRCDPARAV